MSSLLNKESNSNNLKGITLANVCGDRNIVQGYVHNFEGFHTVSSIKDHHLKVDYVHAIVILVLEIQR